MDDTKSFNWILVNELVASLPQKQYDVAQWKVANHGKIAMHGFNVCWFGSFPRLEKAEFIPSRHISHLSSH